MFALLKLSIAAAATALLAMPASAWQLGSGNRVLWEDNCNFHGNDMYNVKQGPEACGDICANDARCTHWTWEMYNGCWIKAGGSGTKTSYNGQGCGYVIGRFTPTSDAQQSSVNNGMSAQENQEMLASINALRANNGLPALTLDDRLMRAADGQSRDQANRCTMGHDSSTGMSLGARISAQGYTWGRVAENVAAGYATVRDVMAGWANSEGHRKNLLDRDVTQVGFAKTVNNNCGTYKVYWTQDFGRQQ